MYKRQEAFDSAKSVFDVHQGVVERRIFLIQKLRSEDCRDSAVCSFDYVFPKWLLSGERHPTVCQRISPPGHYRATNFSPHKQRAHLRSHTLRSVNIYTDFLRSSLLHIDRTLARLFKLLQLSLTLAQVPSIPGQAGLKGFIFT